MGNKMTVNRVIPQPLVFCRQCYWNDKDNKPMKRENWQDTWERFPEKDMKLENGKIFQFAYKCRNCGDIALSPVEAILKVSEIVK
jgi:hypothetical protein